MTDVALYKVAAQIIRSVHLGSTTIKNACYSSNFRNKKILYALVLETCKEWFILNTAIEKSQVKSRELYLLCILIREFANIKGQSPEKFKGILLEFDNNKSRLRSEYVQAKLKIPKLQVPLDEVKYVRINTIKISIEKAIEELLLIGFTEKLVEGEIRVMEFKKDPHMPFLLLFNPSQDFSRLELYNNGSLIIQDKASCIPVFVLDPRPGCKSIDACSAPGNKTTQLASALNSHSKSKVLIEAFEKDPKRFLTLQKMVSISGCEQLIKCTNQDFLTIKPHKGIKYIVVDPSCSGSGMKLSLEKQIQGSEFNLERIKTLANFQTMILKHALSFPDVERVVYSTCSIHEEENECVVLEVLKGCHKWKLIDNPFPDWTTRGLEKYPFYKNVIRSDPEKDKCIGFFVACFEKVNR